MTENEIQRAVFKHLRQRGSPGIFAFHPKNGSRDMRGRGAGIYTGLGVEPGIPDIIVIQGYSQAMAHVYALELKTAERRVTERRGKTMTKHEIDQQNCRVKMEKCGVITGVAFGLDEALIWLETRGLLRGSSQVHQRQASCAP